jgi:hypothetical protein
MYTCTRTSCYVLSVLCILDPPSLCSNTCVAGGKYRCCVTHLRLFVSRILLASHAATLPLYIRLLDTRSRCVRRIVVCRLIPVSVSAVPRRLGESCCASTTIATKRPFLVTCTQLCQSVLVIVRVPVRMLLLIMHHVCLCIQTGTYWVATGGAVGTGTPLRVQCSSGGTQVTGDGRSSANPGTSCTAIINAFGTQDTFFNGSTLLSKSCRMPACRQCI